MKAFRKNDRHTARRDGFTLVEMLVVIGIIGLLAAALLSSFSYVKNSARRAQAQNLVSEAAIAFTQYLQDEREWPGVFLDRANENGGMDEVVCRVFQKGKYLDVAPFKVNVNGQLLNEVNQKSQDRFGLLDPWAQNALKKNPTTTASDEALPGTNRSFADHRLQFRLDKNLDGFVDSSEGAPKGAKIRASVIVWSRGPDGRDDYNNESGRYPKDDSLSWPHGQYK